MQVISIQNFETFVTKYEIRNAHDIEIGSDICKYYEDECALKATTKEEAIAEAEALQEAHDKNARAEYEGTKDFLYAPNYVNNLWEVAYPIIYTANEKGMKYISDFLLEKHKRGDVLFDDNECLNAWAMEAENAIGNCGHPCFEILSFNSKTGHTEVCYLDREHFDCEIGDSEIDCEKVEI